VNGSSTPPRSTLLWALATIACAALTAFLVSFLTVKPRPIVAAPAQAATPSEASFHAWLHENLHISPEQHDRLAPFEEKYEADRLRLREEIRAAGQQLAAAIRENNRDSPNLAAALRQLNTAQGELQQATLDHFFVMKDHLQPEQAEKLLQWTHENILHGYGD